MRAVIRNVAFHPIRELTALPGENASNARYVGALQATVEQLGTGTGASIDHPRTRLNVCELKLVSR
jgi:hypothetical protein